MQVSIFDLVAVSPPRGIKKFIYNCGKTFVTEYVEELFQIEQEQYGIVQVWGEETIVQVSNEFGEIRTLATKTAKIQKRQDRGGQSQNRIARLREETIHNYLKLAGEKIDQCFLSNGNPTVKAVLLIGNGFKKDSMKTYSTVLTKVPVYVHDWQRTEPISSLIRDMIDREHGTESKNNDDRLQEAINLQSDRLVFGLETILNEMNEIEYVFSRKQMDVPKPVYICSDFINRFGGMVGVRYLSVGDE